jgi:hypothetical protein
MTITSTASAISSVATRGMPPTRRNHGTPKTSGARHAPAPTLWRTSFDNLVGKEIAATTAIMTGVSRASAEAVRFNRVVWGKRRSPHSP